MQRGGAFKRFKRKAPTVRPPPIRRALAVDTAHVRDPCGGLAVYEQALEYEAEPERPAKRARAESCLPEEPLPGDEPPTASEWEDVPLPEPPVPSSITQTLRGASKSEGRKQEHPKTARVSVS